MIKCIPGHKEGQRNGTKRRQFTAQFEAKVATEALRGASNQVSGWKRQAQAGLEEVFAGATSRGQKDHEAIVHDLHAKIGELTVERDFYRAGSGAEPGRAACDNRPRTPECEPAMPTARREPLDGVLPSARGERADPGVDAPDRRAVPGLPVLRQPTDDASLGARGGGGRSAPGAAAGLLVWQCAVAIVATACKWIFR